jgi:endonuclease YncB( thermonuclease family)
MYEYRATIVKVIDGDTVDVDIDLGFGIVLSDERVRIMGIDTPETLKTQINKSGEDMKGKFGRILGDFDVYDNKTDSWQPVTKVLVSEGHAVPYHGQNKEDIQTAHLANRVKLLEEGVVQ